MKIRIARPSDEESIRQIHHQAFEAGERELVSALVGNLLQEQTSPQIIHLVADDGDGLVGHVAFSPVFTKEDERLAGWLLAPLAVNPQSQKRGVGKQLVEFGIKESAQDDTNIILVYGDPDYYARFGFRTAVAENFIPPFELKYPAGWQGIDLGNNSPLRTPVSITCVTPLNQPELW